ncbi:MAG: hypothetical protein IH901_08800 [Proteobacteria bacterium]|nr:hypothetical protein [Pseudomonadota bacterium]
MKPLRMILSALCGALLFAGGALAGDSTAEQYLAEMAIIAEALEGISDDASASEAAKAMGAALARLEPISEEMQAWSEAEKMNFVRSYPEEYMGVHMRISRALSLMVQYPERMELFIDHMKNMPRLD